jgi:Tol biopolymer transport system component
VIDDRWQRVKALFQAAVERPAAERDAFLASATGEDEALRREVESLLASDDAELSFLDRVQDAGKAMFADLPAAVRVSIAATPTHTILAAHRRIGSYEIVAPLGAGAMGEVYRARDTKLNRDVALKVLPELYSRDPSRLARFRREAKLLAALNHPNIAAIYGLEESSDLQALVLELVEGPTLADRIARGAIPLEQALLIAKQIAGALEAAHEQGIVHRDLKPSNIKVRADGVVKVLDFGLAKALATEPGNVLDSERSPARDTAATREGIILGTAAYMAPEQAKGLTVDERADIWAFGCVLFEMLAGTPTFRGETVTEVLASVVRDDPGWARLPATTPTTVRRLLLRCLAKDPKRRLRDIGDGRIEIESIDQAIPGVSDAGPAVATRPRTAWLPWLAVAALAIGVIAREASRAPINPENPLANARFTPFTNWEGTEEGAAISPDGRFVAFLADHEGEFDLWVTQVGTESFSNLTRDMPPLGGSGVIVRKLGFSGDGTDIWFNASDARPLMRMPLTGGAPRLFLPPSSTPAWSPDGSHLVYVDKSNDNDPILIADHTGADPREILPPGELKNNNPVWSTDGQWIYFVRGSEPQDEIGMDVWRVRSSGGSPERLTEQRSGVNFLAPIDAHTLLYVARDADWSGPWLWSLDVDRKLTHRVPSGSDQYTSVASSRDGRRVVATVANPSATLWRVPLLDHQAEERDAQLYPVPVPTGRALAPRFGGSSLFYLSARGTGDGLWRVLDGHASEVWRNADGALFEPPLVSPDGQRVAVVVRQQSRRHLVIMSADGTNRRTLAASIEIEGVAGQSAGDWSPDGKWIIAGGRDAKGPALFKIPVDGGGAPVRLVDGKWVNPVWSPAGDLIVYAGRSVIGQVKLLAMRPQDGTPVDLGEVMARPGGYRFLRNGKGIVYVPRIQSLDFWLLDLATKTKRQITQLGNRGALRTFDITPDGKYIVFDRSRQNSNIVLIDLPKP